MKILFQPASDLLNGYFKSCRAVLVGRRFGRVTATQSISAVQPVTLRRQAWLRTKPVLAPAKLTKLVLPRLLNFIGVGLTTVALVMAVVMFVPDLYYRFFPADIQPIAANSEGTPLGGDFADGSQGRDNNQPVLPPQNPALPSGDWIVIPRIGVRTKLQATEKAEEALAEGAWRAPDYGKPGDASLPIIVAGHRFGWQWWWQSDYWKYNSFYQLPELEPGDLVEIISDQRKWVYEVYAGEQGEKITDYEADLILYTCKFLNSPVRHFRYARLVDLSQNTQSK